MRDMTSNVTQVFLPPVWEVSGFCLPNLFSLLSGGTVNQKNLFQYTQWSISSIIFSDLMPEKPKK